MKKPNIEKFLNNQCSFEEAKLIINDILKNRTSIDDIDLFDNLTYDDYNHADLIFKKRLQLEYFPHRKFKSLLPLARIASVAIIFFALTSGAIKIDEGHFTLSRTTTYFNPGEDESYAILPDSSHLILMPNTSITFPTNFKVARRIRQERGTATYYVLHNSKSPFVVEMNNILTTAIGTIFTVEAGQDYRAKVLLHEGSVRVVDKSNKQNLKFYLKPGQFIVFDKEFQTIIHSQNKGNILPDWPNEASESFINNSTDLQWTNDNVSFHKIEVQEVFNIIEQLFDVRIFVQSDRVLLNSFTGRIYRTDNLEKLLRNLAVLMNIHYTIDKNVITISQMEAEPT